MKNKILHIVSFDNPYPPNYGGAIDVFYKLKFLKESGYSIILHVYADDLKIDKELSDLCFKLYFYKREKYYLHHFSRLPFIVKSRFDKRILINLKKDNYPVIFEGIHTTLPVFKADFSNRKLYLRAHNIEHNYYTGLYESETNVLKKIIFKIESYKLKRYENKIIPYMDSILSISNFEFDYFSKKYNTKTKLLPVFHQNKESVKLSKKGSFALYQGDLRVADNKRVVAKLIQIFSEINYPLIIASNIEGIVFNKLYSKCTSNISYEKIKSNSHLLSLFSRAHINVLFSYQNTGTKLKLINALYNSRFCLINENMIDDEALKRFCVVENNLSKYKEIIYTLTLKEYHLSEEKEKALSSFTDKKNEIIKNLLD